jgi:hypothetical protein
MIEFTEDRYFAALFFIGFTGMDILGAIWRKQDEPNQWIQQWRFRYDTADENDRRSWWSAKIDAPEDEVVAKAQVLFAAMQFNPFSGEQAEASYWVPIQGDGRRAAEILSSFNWAHFTRETE